MKYPDEFPVNYREDIIRILIDNGTEPDLLVHVIRIERISQLLADQMEAEGIQVDRQVLEAGALLHDLGLPMRKGEPITIEAFGGKAEGLTSDDLMHPILGARRAAEHGFPKSVTRCILRHIPGPSIAECQELGYDLPPEETIPEAMEEKIIAYADFMNWVALLGLNPWQDPDAVVKAGVPYISYFFMRELGESLGYESAPAQRWRDLDAEMRHYARAEFWDMA